jgi:hypothetical protein
LLNRETADLNKDKVRVSRQNMKSVKAMKEGIRNSRMFLNEVYFWTDTIKDWKLLLAHDLLKWIAGDLNKEYSVIQKLRPLG